MDRLNPAGHNRDFQLVIEAPSAKRYQRMSVTAHGNRFMEVQQGFSQFGPTELIHVPKKDSWAKRDVRLSPQDHRRR